MAIAISLQEFLENSGIDYDVLPHAHTDSSISTAKATHISPDDMAKAVIVEDQGGYLMSVIPATHQLELDLLSRQLQRRLELAGEDELARLFVDCEVGAIPPVGMAYHMDVIIDDSLSDRSDVYFEAGDHTEVIHVRGQDFQKLMQGARRGHFSRRVS